MTRVMLTALAIVLLPANLAADETVIRLSVEPKTAPKPVLKYLLLPEMSELTPGNPIYNYLKCDFEEYHFLFDKEQFARWEPGAGDAAQRATS